jgi:hypothetical protein
MRVQHKIRERLENTQRAKAQIKIFYIGGFSRSYDTEVYIAHGFRELGVDVKCWDENLNLSPEMLIERIEDFDPDFVLLSKNRRYGLDIIKRLKGKYLTVSWLFDLYHDLPQEMGNSRGFKDNPFFADVVFMSDGGELEVKKETLRQGIHEPEAKLLKREYKYDVAFIGADTYMKRHQLLEFLRETYKDRFVHYGMGGLPETRGMELNEILATSKVIVGDSVPADKYWSNRIYEVLGRGGFLLHPRVRGLEGEFQYYKHFIPFDHGNFEQIKEIVDYFISHDKEREKIRLAGHKFCKNNYTYKIRCEELLSVVL